MFNQFKSLPWNMFGLILKKQYGHHGSLMDIIKEFCYPCTAKGTIGRVLKFTGFMHHYNSLPGNIILKNKMAATGISSTVMNECLEIFQLCL